MGSTIPPEPPIEYGDDCLYCFPPGRTPLHVTANFSGITDCWPDVPPGHGVPPSEMVMTQSPVDPCYWTVGGAWEWIAAYVIGFGLPAELYLNFGFISYFTGYDADECATHFTNENICASGLIHGEGGTGSAS